MSLQNPEIKPVLEAKGLSVAYGGRTVLEVPSVKVFPNQVLAIIGPNGSGKTTLSLCLSLLLKPTTGHIFYNGNSVPDGQSALQMRRRFAVVFQESLLLNTSVWENVILGLRLRGFPATEIKNRGPAMVGPFRNRQSGVKTGPHTFGR